MTLLPVVVLFSGALSFCLLWLLFVEQKQGQRIIFPAQRSDFDRAVMRLRVWYSALSMYVGFGTIRYFIHYAFHKVLSLLLHLLQQLKEYVARLQKKNRTVANEVREQEIRSHLNIIAEHKKAAGTKLQTKKKPKVSVE